VSGTGTVEDTPIEFGTSGWRGILGEEVTYPRLRRVARATAAWIREQGEGDRVLVGYDGRFASEAMAHCCADELLAAGLSPRLSESVVPTPAVAHAIQARRVAAALVLTASHNPPAYHGLKILGAWGGSITDPHARRIEALLESEEPVAAPSPRSHKRVDLLGPYRSILAQQLTAPPEAFNALTVYYDAMHGAGSGVLDRVLSEAGTRVVVLRGERDPHFGGESPDPVPARLQQLAERVREHRGLAVGLATDGDADRIGVVDATGRILTETQVIGLLVDHLAEVGRVKTGVAITAGTGSLVPKIARARGLAVERHPVGFKHLSAALESGRADVAGEESGGFALGAVSRDKDGILAGCLLADLVASHGLGLEQRIDALEARFGTSACGRSAVPSTPALEAGYEALCADPPERVGRVRVVEVQTGSALRLGLEDDGFVMYRRSGTEPMLRLYAEAPDADALEARLASAERLLRKASGS